MYTCMWCIGSPIIFETVINLKLISRFHYMVPVASFFRIQRNKCSTSHRSRQSWTRFYDDFCSWTRYSLYELLHNMQHVYYANFLIFLLESIWLPQNISILYLISYIASIYILEYKSLQLFFGKTRFLDSWQVHSAAIVLLLSKGFQISSNPSSFFKFSLCHLESLVGNFPEINVVDVIRPEYFALVDEYL